MLMRMALLFVIDARTCICFASVIHGDLQWNVDGLAGSICWKPGDSTKGFFLVFILF